jgi:hypothetical protein
MLHPRKTLSTPPRRHGKSLLVLALFFCASLLPALTADISEETVREAKAKAKLLEAQRKQADEDKRLARKAALQLERDIQLLQKKQARLENVYQQKLSQQLKTAAQDLILANNTLATAQSTAIELEKVAEAAKRSHEQAQALIEQRIKSLADALGKTAREAALQALTEAKRDAAARETAYWTAKTDAAKANLAVTWQQKLVNAAQEHYAGIRASAPELADLLEQQRQKAGSEAAAKLALEKQRRLEKAQLREQELQAAIAAEAAKLQRDYEALARKTASAQETQEQLQAKLTSTEAQLQAKKVSQNQVQTGLTQATEELARQQNQEAEAWQNVETVQTELEQARAAEAKRQAESLAAAKAAARQAEEERLAQIRAQKLEAERLAAEARRLAQEEKARLALALKQQRLQEKRTLAQDQLVQEQIDRRKKELANAKQLAASADAPEKHLAQKQVESIQLALEQTLKDSENVRIAAAEIREIRNKELEARWQHAQTTKWELSFGPSYRQLHDVDFNAISFQNYDNQSNGTTVTGPNDPSPTSETVRNGAYGVQNLGGPEDVTTISDPTNTLNDYFDLPSPLSFDGITVADGVNVALDYIRYNGGSDNFGSEEGLAPALGLERKLVNRQAWQLSFVGNLQYLEPDLSESHSGRMGDNYDFTHKQYSHSVVDANGGSGNPATDISIVINPVAIGTDSSPKDDNTAYSIRNELDLSLFMLDLGLKLGIKHKRLLFNGAAGLTLNYADMKSSQLMTASWNDISSSEGPFAAPPIVIDAGTYREEQDDSLSRLLAGGYISAGLSYALTPSLKLSSDFRYDFVENSLRTDQAKVDLNGFSLQLRLSVNF